MTVRLTEEQKIKVANGRDLYRIMQAVLKREKKLDRGKEHVWVVALAQNHRILMIELVGLGSPRRAVVEPVDVFSFALQKQASKIILVHNHPSGELKPSADDRIITSQMLSVGRLVECRMLDHLIISETSYYSFQESGLLAELEHDAVDLTFQQVKAVQQQLKIAEQRHAAERDQLTTELENKDRQHAAELEQKAVAMAGVLLGEGFEPAKVARLTGLTEAQVAALAAGR